MKKIIIDINADVGEGIENEALLMPYLSSCNIACGGHAGDIQTMREVVMLAKTYDVKIGAHPSFPDRENFGRKAIEISPKALKNSIINQVQSLQEILISENTKLHHLKMHGALYNLSAIDKDIAKTVVEAINELEIKALLYVPYASAIAKEALENKIPIVYEAFADRNYKQNLSLVSRNEPNAIIEDEEQVFQHLLKIITKRKVKTIEGNFSPIKATTFCVHGDHPHTLAILKYLHKKLKEHAIEIA